MKFDIREYFHFPVRVTIFDTRNHGFVIRHDKAKAIYDKEYDIPEYKLKKIKATVKPPSLRFISRDAQGHDVLYLLQVERNKFIPVMPPDIKEESLFNDKEEFGKFKVKLEEDLVANMWNRVVKKKKEQVYKKSDFWQKYGAIISLVLISGIMLMSLIITTNYLQKNIITEGDRVVTALNNVADKFEGQTDVVQGGNNFVPITPDPDAPPI